MNYELSLVRGSHDKLIKNVVTVVAITDSTEVIQLICEPSTQTLNTTTTTTTFRLYIRHLTLVFPATKSKCQLN